ncbi:MAG: 2-C-methyl-D-erythritol 4-phosphate cytidylyltransferase [Blautia sp.]|nr:2-C-methyl-D-erythritol 4-phosphate cytidylyltransferase [Blautia sp.]
MDTTAIVLAAGRGKRMQSGTPKQFMLLRGKPLLYYSLRVFEDSPLVDHVILVTEEENIAFCRSEIVERYGFHKVERITAGGKERYDSVYQGLIACEGTDYVLIHDSARPFIDGLMLERGLSAAVKYKACVLAMPSKDTVKIAGEDGFVKETPDRSRVWIIQTPQIFSYDLVRNAYDQLRAVGMEGVTDDAMVVEKAAGRKVYLVEGDYKNIKITTPEDLETAEYRLAKNEREI